VGRWRWLRPVAVALAVPFVAFSMVGISGIPAPVLLAVVVVVAIVLWRRRGTGLPAALDRWAGPPVPASAGSGAVADPWASGPRGPARPVALALAPVESQHLATDPWFAVGVGFWMVLIAVFGVFFPDDAEWSRWQLYALLPAFAHPFVGCWIVAVHRGVTRARRAGDEELLESCPASGDDRAVGFLLTAWLALVVTVVAAGALLVMVELRNPHVFGPGGRRVVVDLFVTAILPIGGTALGVALGRWAPWRLVPIVAVLAVAALSQVISKLGDSSYERVRSLVGWADGTPFDTVFHDPPTWERVAWLGGLTVVVTGVALLRGAHRRVATGAMAVGASLAVLAAASLVGPVPAGQAAEMAALISDPAGHAECRAASPTVRVCTYAAYADLGADVAAELVPVAAALPGWVAPARFAQGFDGVVEDLPREVRDRIGPSSTEGDGLYLGYSSHPEALRAARYRLAADALGLPSDPQFPGLSVAGEARGIVLLWLATRGLTAAQVATAFAPYDPLDAPSALLGDVWPGRCHDEEATVVWGQRDLAAALIVAGDDERDVSRVITQGWDHWIDPATPRDELLAALGHEPLGPADAVDPSLADRCV
jgi:hypothetical protein